MIRCDYIYRDCGFEYAFAVSTKKLKKEETVYNAWLSG